MAKALTKAQLGRGHVNFCKECALEPREWQAGLDPLEYGGVHEEEGFFKACAIIDAHGFTFPTRPNRHVRIVFPPKHTMLFISLALPVRYYVFVGGYLGSFDQDFIRCPTVEGFVIDRRRRVRCGFCSGHLDKKAKKGEEKGRKTRV